MHVRLHLAAIQPYYTARKITAAGHGGECNRYATVEYRGYDAH
jgi:hypothetical protein